MCTSHCLIDLEEMFPNSEIELLNIIPPFSLMTQAGQEYARWDVPLIIHVAEEDASQAISLLSMEMPHMIHYDNFRGYTESIYSHLDLGVDKINIYY